MAQRSKHTVEEAGFDFSGSKTSLIQYFRWRNRASEQLLTAAADSWQDSSSVAEPKSEYIASGRTPFPSGISARGLRLDRSGGQCRSFKAVRGEHFVRGSIVFSPTLCLGRERHTVAADSVETPTKYFNSVPSGEAYFAALVGLFFLRGECCFLTLGSSMCVYFIETFPVVCFGALTSGRKRCFTWSSGKLDGG